MIVVTNAVLILCMLLVLMQSYPLAVVAWLDALLSVVERWLDRWADAAQNRLRERVRWEELRLMELQEEQAALQWMQTVLITLPLGEPV